MSERDQWLDDVRMLRATVIIIRGCEAADDSMSGVRQGEALSDRLAAFIHRLEAGGVER